VGLARTLSSLLIYFQKVNITNYRCLCARYDGHSFVCVQIKKLATELTMSTKGNTASRKRKISTLTIVDAASLLNRIPPQVALDLFEKEPKDQQGNCIVSCRSIPAREYYPRLQLPKNVVHQHCSDLVDQKLQWKQQKGRFKVMVHQLAFRSTGAQLPAYADNNDLCHVCGNGRKSDSSGPCINPVHLQIGEHKTNMNAQGCLGIVTCTTCTSDIPVCNHTPKCRPTKRTKVEDSDCVVKVVLHYESGRTKTVELYAESSSK
jgi:hypothetical protein